MAFTVSATSGRTGRGYDFDFEKEPTEIDIDEAIVAADAEAEAAEVAAQGPVESGVKTGFRDFGPALTTRPLAGVFGMLDKAADVVANVTGTQKGGGFGQVAGFMEDINAESERVIPTNPENKVANAIGSGVSQGLGLLTGMGALRAAGLGTKAMAGFPLAIGAASGAGEGLSTAEEFGIDTPEKQLAMGFLFGLTEFATEKALGGFGSKEATQALMDAYRKPAGEILKKAVKTTLGEGVEEPLAGLGQDLITRAFADEDPENPGFTRTGVELPKLTDLEKRKLEMIGGMAGGTVFAGAQIAANAVAPREGDGETNELPNAQAGASVESGVAETFGGSMGRTTLPDGRRVAFDLAALSPDQVAAMTPETLEAAMGAGLVSEVISDQSSVISDQSSVISGEAEGVRGATGAGGPQGTTTAGATGVDRTSAREIDRLAGQLAAPPKERTLLGNDPTIGSRAQVQMGQAVPVGSTQRRLPPTPEGSEDILNWLTFNRILAPRKGTERKGSGEYNWREAGDFPAKYRDAIMKEGPPNIDTVAAEAFKKGLISENTPEALVAEIRSAIQHRETAAELKGREEQRLEAAEAARVRFDKEQAQREADSPVVDADALVRGDRIAVGESVYEVMDIQMDEDGRTLGYDVVDADGQVIGVDVSEGGQMVGVVSRKAAEPQRNEGSGMGEDLPFARGGMRAGQGAGVLADSRDATETDRQKAQDTTGLIRDQASFRRAWPGKYRGGWSVSDAPNTESARSASRLAGALGVRLVWFDDGGADPGDSLRGWRGSQPRTIYLNKNLATNKAGRESLGPLNVAAHEIMHVLEMEQPDVYADLLAWLKPRLNEGKIREVLARLGYDKAKEDLDAEAVAHLAGELALEPAFYEQVLKEEPGLAARIAAVIGAVLERLKRAFLSGLDLQVNAGGQMTLEEMLNAQGRTEEAEVMKRVTEALRTLRGGEGMRNEELGMRNGVAAARGVGEPVTAEMDAAYLAAVEAGDTVEAQRLVLEASGVELVDSSIDRGGAHSPADPDSGAPAWGLTLNGIYPDDVYSANGLRYYGTGEAQMDAEAVGILRRLKGSAARRVTVYRAIEKGDKRRGIEPGAWVTISRQYAADHGRSALGGDYRIQEKVVSAGEIFTSGDSWLEWGYHPQPPGVFKKAIARDDDGNVVPLSKRVSDQAPAAARGVRESEFGERMQADERMSPGMREASPAVFEVRPQQRQHDEARAIIRTMGLAEALVHFSRDDTGLERSVRIAGLMQVAQNYDVRHLAAARRGDDAGMAEADRELEKAIEAKVELEILGNETGRALAMYNTWARLSPNGMLERFGRNLRKKRRESLEQDTGATTAEVTGAINEEVAAVQRQTTDEILNEVLAGMEGFQPVQVREPMMRGVLRGIGRIAGRIADSATLERLAQAADDALKAIQGKLFADPFMLTPLAQAALQAVRDSLRAGMRLAAAVEAGIDAGIRETGETGVDRKAAARSLTAAVTQELVRPILSRLALDNNYTIKQAAADLEAAGVPKQRALQVARDVAGKRKTIQKRSREAVKDRVLKKLAPKKHAKRRKQKMPKIIDTLMEAEGAGLMDGGVTERQVLDAYGKAFKLPDLTPEQTRKLTAMAGELNKLPEGVLRQDKAREFLNEMALIEGIPASDAILSMWYANILSGIGTQGVNVWGNGTMALLKGVAAMAASPREARRYLKAARTMGLRQGLREGAAALRKGVGHKTNLKWDEAQRLNGLELISSQGGPKNLSQWIAWVGSVGGLTRYVFRLLGAMDLMFYYSAHEGMTALATARTIRKDQKLKPGTRAFEAEFIRQMGGDESQWAADLDQARQELRAAGQAVDERLVNRRAYELRVERRSDRVREQASRWADRLTFQQDPEGFAREISGAIKRIQNITPLGVPVGRLLVPFNKIVSNVFENGIDFTPIGIARAAVGGHLTDRSKWGTMDVVERRERALSGVIGLGFASLFYALTKAWDDDDDVDAPFRLYGPGPGSAAGRAAMPAGWRPYSFKWGDKYVIYAETPMGPMLAAVGALLDVERYSTSYGKKTAGDRAKMAIQAALRSFSSQGVLSTVQDGIEVLSGDTWKDPTSLLGNPVRGVVPASGLVRDIGELFDNTKISDDDLYGAMVKDVPVVRNYGTFPDRNWRGEPLTQAGLPVVRRFVTKQKLDKESAWMGRNRLRVSMIEPHILVGQYTGIPEAAQGLPLVESYARRGLQLTALENGAFTRPQWDRFTKRAGELTAERVKVLRETYEARFPEGRVPVEMQEDLQNHVNRIVQAARKTAMLEEMGRVR